MDCSIAQYAPLNFRGVVFFIGEVGPPHSREFSYSVTVRGWSFSGSGKTKKLAKAAAAESALQYLNNVVNVGPSATGVSMVKSRAEEIGEEREGERVRGKGRELFGVQICSCACTLIISVVDCCSRA